MSDNFRKQDDSHRPDKNRRESGYGGYGQREQEREQSTMSTSSHKRRRSRSEDSDSQGRPRSSRRRYYGNDDRSSSGNTGSSSQGRQQRSPFSQSRRPSNQDSYGHRSSQYPGEGSSGHRDRRGSSVSSAFQNSSAGRDDYHNRRGSGSSRPHGRTMHDNTSLRGRSFSGSASFHESHQPSNTWRSSSRRQSSQFDSVNMSGFREVKDPNDRQTPSNTLRNSIELIHSTIGISISRDAPKNKNPSVEDKKGPEEERNARRQQWICDASSICNYEPPVRTATDGTVLANCFKVTFNGGAAANLIKYKIKLGTIKGKPVISKQGKKNLIKALLQNIPPDTTAWASDFEERIVSCGPLYQKPNDCVTSKDEGYEVKHPLVFGEAGMTTIIQRLGKIEYEKLNDFTNPKSQPDPNYVPDDDLRHLNIIIRKFVEEADVKVGRVGNKFYPNYQHRAYSDVSHNSALWIKSGYFCSMRPGEGSLIMGINSTTSAFYAPTKLQNWIEQRYSSSHYGEPLPGRVKNELKGLRVKFEGRREGKGPGSKDGCQQEAKHWSIHSIVDGKSVSQVEFICKENGEPIKVYDYIAKEFCRPEGNLERDQLSENAYCVNVGDNTRKIYYPADQLSIVEWQPFKGHMEEMLRKANRAPNKNSTLIEDFRKHGLGGDHKRFGLSIEDNFLSPKFRKIDPPTLQYGQDRVAQRSHHANMTTKKPPTKNPNSWNLGLIEKFYDVKGGELSAIHVIIIGDHVHLKLSKSFFDDLSKALSHHVASKENLQVLEFHVPDIPEEADNVQDRRILFEHFLNEAVDKLTEDSLDKKQPKLIFVLIPHQKAKHDYYDDVKWWGDCRRGIPTIVLKAKKLSNTDPILKANLCLKVNFKLGGTNHMLQDTTRLKRQTMVVGADVTHPTRCIDAGCPSLAGVVATNTGGDQTNHYLASARLQANNTEFIRDLKGMMVERLKSWKDCNDSPLPEHILFYRDGVGESQYGMVLKKELPQIERAIKEFRENEALPSSLQNPKITLVVVGKRHHTRFFPALQPPDKLEYNLEGGSVIDSGVIDPKRFNFYLQSHDSPLGTAKSAHYVVIHNGSSYTAEELQNATNQLCHVGSRATVPLSKCVAVQYADFLCRRLRCYMGPVLDGSVTDFINNADVEDYRKEKLIWGSSVNERSNPWKESLDNIMFYI
ncbi:hypothetical protein HYFRA_00002907 [Hymenoscyphus fraxineus]|uniref:Piwi domain-containing protein n=1 Tax=Hymenoscyphus fraxineus TaxID=746836 RepID=A0A9N9KSC4_9HELO|nr:hypothetical protein HYFRA_00002907 [Hymenoscyphus fraxineus]